MSAATPSPAFPVLWRDTQAGRAERWTREKMLQMLGRQHDRKTTEKKGN